MSEEEAFAINFIEQTARDIGHAGNPVRPLLSIAVSLRRIADSLDRMGKAVNYGGASVYGGNTEAGASLMVAEIGQLRAALLRVLPYTVNEGTRIVNDALGLNDDKPRGN